MEPGQQEIQTRTLIRRFHHTRGRHGGEGAQQIGAHAWRRLVRKYAAGAKQVDRQARVDLAG